MTFIKWLMFDVRNLHDKAIFAQIICLNYKKSHEVKEVILDVFYQVIRLKDEQQSHWYI